MPLKPLNITEIGRNAFANTYLTSATIPRSGASYFSDPQWANYPARFYRFYMP
jgi:hypothetical protein